MATLPVSIRVAVSTPPVIRVNVALPFPASVQGTGGIKVIKNAGGIWVISPDFPSLPILGSLPNPASKEIWVFDPVTGIYSLLTLSTLANAVFSGQYFLTMWADGNVIALERLMEHQFDVQVTFPANFAGSLASARLASTATKIYSVQKNEVEFAQVTFSAGNVNGSFSVVAATTFAPGDILGVVAPAATDATLNGIRINFNGNRSV